MTKFILHGGGEGGGGVEHDDFFREIINSLPKKSTVLCVYFAIPDDRVTEKHAVYVDYFTRNNTENKDISLIIASKEGFVGELRCADAVYFRGGDTHMLLEQIKKYDNFENELLKKIVVAGSSAGVYFLSQASYSSRRNVVYEGLGILPIKSNCHYDTKKNVHILDRYSGDLILLEEGAYKIIEK